MSTWLFSIAFDLLASTLVASTRYTSSLLGLLFRCLIVADVIRLGMFLTKVRSILLLGVGEA
jgi:hypothetical protein